MAAHQGFSTGSSCRTHALVMVAERGRKLHTDPAVRLRARLRLLQAQWVHAVRHTCTFSWSQPPSCSSPFAPWHCTPQLQSSVAFCLPPSCPCTRRKQVTTWTFLQRHTLIQAPLIGCCRRPGCASSGGVSLTSRALHTRRPLAACPSQQCKRRSTPLAGPLSLPG